MNARIEAIQRAVEKAAECPAEHLESVPTLEMFRGEVVWEGVVEVFALTGHAKAKKAYGWSYQDGAGRRYVVVLEIPPVSSPNTAVRAAIASQARQ